MHQDGSLPRARRDGLLEETVGEELLLYDQNSHTAHCLSPIAACVWQHCDGERDIAELARVAGANEDLVAGALHELREKDLLVAEPEFVQSTVSGVSRREAIVRAARYGAAAAVGSMIVSATAATPAMASSGEEIEGQESYMLATFVGETGTFTNTSKLSRELTSTPEAEPGKGAITSNGTCTVGTILSGGGSFNTCTFTQKTETGAKIKFKYL